LQSNRLSNRARRARRVLLGDRSIDAPFAFRPPGAYLPLGAPSTKISVVDDADVLRAFVRGEVSTDALARLGYNLTSEVGGLRLDAPVSGGVELPLADLAAGLLRQWALGTTLREWAAVVLMLSDVQFQEAESPDEDRLLDAVWSASAGEPVPDDALRLARQLALGA